MSFRLSHIHEYNTFIALDIGSHHVKAMIYKIDAGTCVSLGKSRIRQNRKDFLNGSISNLQGVAQTLERAILEAGSKLESIPEDIILSFSPEFMVHDAVTTQYIRSDREKPIDMEEIDIMIQKIEKESLDRAKEKSLKQFGKIHDDIRLVSSTLTTIAIDGKVVTNPLGFSGSKIKIKILNIFAPASEFNIIRSIIASLGKEIISIIPTPLLFSKITENTDYISTNNAYIDIGYMHTTIVFESHGEILSFETFGFGTKMLLDMLLNTFPEKTYLEIENILFDDNGETIKIQEKILNDFFQYLVDIFLALIAREKDALALHAIFLSGGIFSHEKFRSKFSHTFHTSYDPDISILHLQKTLDKKVDPDFMICHALGILAEELLVTKKDPIIRILRYVLYNNE